MSAKQGSKGVFTLVAGLAIGLAAGVAVSPLLRAKLPGAQAPAGPAPTPAAQGSYVTALGRLRPRNGVLRVAGPSQLVVVVGRLMVEEGDRVRRGQTIAVLDNHASQEAAVERLKANLGAQIAAAARTEAVLRTAQNEYGRLSNLHKEGTISDSQRDSSKLEADAGQADLTRARAEIDLARADLRRAQEDFELTVVRAPIDGQVLKIHTRAGEKVGEEGIVELADNQQMYAVAEVYESDIARIKVGQRATVRTPVLDRELTGVVERVGLKIGKMDVLGTDPAAKTDARVVEVEVRLDESARVNASTNLQVTVSIDVSRHGPAAGAGS